MAPDNLKLFSCLTVLMCVSGKDSHPLNSTPATQQRQQNTTLACIHSANVLTCTIALLSCEFDKTETKMRPAKRLYGPNSCMYSMNSDMYRTASVVKMKLLVPSQG